MEIVALSLPWCDPLLDFLMALERDREHRLFQPHPFSREALEAIVQGARSDIYRVLVEGPRVLGYGMLRGWDAGYAIPSLGIAVHPTVRRQGLARALMGFLHVCAVHRGAEQVRLRVHAENAGAIRLYRELGYRFDSEEGGLLVGRLDLGGGAR